MVGRAWSGISSGCHGLVSGYQDLDRFTYLSLPAFPRLVATYTRCSRHPARGLLHLHAVVINFEVRDQLTKIMIWSMNIGLLTGFSHVMRCTLVACS